MDFRTGRHVVHALTAHLVFVPKRRRVITARAFDVLRSSWEATCADFESRLIESEYESDHVCLLVGFPPKVALSALVNSLKGVSARRLRAARLPEIERKMLGVKFWSPSYCAVSSGASSLEVVKRYVEARHGDAGGHS